MDITATMVLWLIMLALVVGFVPLGGAWTKLLLWGGLALLTVVLVLTRVLHFVRC